MRSRYVDDSAITMPMIPNMLPAFAFFCDARPLSDRMNRMLTATYEMGVMFSIIVSCSFFDNNNNKKKERGDTPKRKKKQTNTTGKKNQTRKKQKKIEDRRKEKKTLAGNLVFLFVLLILLSLVQKPCFLSHGC